MEKEERKARRQMLAMRLWDVETRLSEAISALDDGVPGELAVRQELVVMLSRVGKLRTRMMPQEVMG